MNNEEKQHIADILSASAAGKAIEYKSLFDGKWMDQCPFKNANSIFQHPDHWRIKYEPKRRYWDRPEDVPGPVCWLRNGQEDTLPILHVGFCSRQHGEFSGSTGILAGHSYAIRWYDMPLWEYSTDRKTWHKCEVTEEA